MPAGMPAGMPCCIIAIMAGRPEIEPNPHIEYGHYGHYGRDGHNDRMGIMAISEKTVNNGHI